MLLLGTLLAFSAATSSLAANGRKAFKIREHKTMLPLLPHHLQESFSPVSPDNLSTITTGSLAANKKDGHRGKEQRYRKLEGVRSRATKDIVAGEKSTYSQEEIRGWTLEERQVRQLDWELQIAYEGKTFFDGWDFFTKPDPTHGLVNYIDGPSAFERGNAFWTGDGKPGIQADHWSNLPVGTPRDSVRITTKSLFSGGLIIVDLALAPWSCGVWPAIWTLGYEGEWPTTGEIDILEGIQAMTNNHTLPGCEINQTAGLYTGTIGHTVCDSTTGGSGCTIVSPSAASFGEPFNSAGGGVFAMLWSGDGIRMWDWTRASIPSDIASGHPRPESWGVPAAAWDASTCDPKQFFQAQVIVVNIDLCGDWAGDLYSTFPYCPGTCAEYVSNPLNLNNTVMLLNSIKVYQQSGVSPTAQQAETNNNLTGAGGAVPLNESGASALANPGPDQTGAQAGSNSGIGDGGDGSETAGGRTTGSVVGAGGNGSVMPNSGAAAPLSLKRYSGLSMALAMTVGLIGGVISIL
ncbi:hypothetical protein I316_05168 [Kwoniella heveanensis BCC8398]|uniref:GH16 domain-containing protein n=1 Tax=Kwoniella heveanensis BCC8398 TaxID=1296120 RepID=A0A1B9GQ35_9TREE|nr:hypothetical protein I316_05168 [Kwoniella heveanensis BCC8398]